MRVLLLPIVQLSAVSDSDYNVLKDIVLHSVKHSGKFFFYLCLPKKRSMSATAEDLRQWKTFLYDVGGSRYVSFFHEQLMYPDLVHYLFNRQLGKFPVDAVITTRTGAVPSIRNAIDDWRRNVGIPVILWESLFRLYRGGVSNEHVLRAISYSLADLVVALNPREKQMILGLCRKFVSPSLLVGLHDRVKSFYRGVNVDRLDQYVGGEKRATPTVFFGARFSEDKAPDKMIELLSKLHAVGTNFQALFTSQSSEFVVSKYANAARFPLEIHPSCRRSQFYKLLTEAHAFVCTSVKESFPVGFWEQLYVLRVGVIPDASWSRDLFPRTWPFLYKSESDAVAMLRWILENYDEAMQRVSWVRPWIRRHCNAATRDDFVLDFLAERMPKYRIGGSFGEMVDDLLASYLRRGLSRVAWMQLMGDIQRNSRTFEFGQKSRAATPSFYDIYLHVLGGEWEDTCEFQYPIFEVK